MYRSTKQKVVKRIGLSAVLAVGVLGTGIGVANATTHSHSRHAHDTGVSASTSDRGKEGSRDANEGHSFAVRGFITAVSSTSITVSGPSGASTTFALDSSTNVMKGHTAATVADLKVGDRVFIVPSSTSSTTAASVFIAGTEDRNGQNQQGQNQQGQNQQGQNQQGQNQVINDSSVEGVVSAVSGTSITITEEGGVSATFALDSSTAVTMGHSTGSVASLAVGEKVQITPSSTSSATAASVEIDLAYVAGTVTGVSGDSITITTEGGASVTVVASSSTTITMNGSSTTLAGVTTGSFIHAEGTMASASTFDAVSIGVGAPQGDDDQAQVGSSTSDEGSLSLPGGSDSVGVSGSVSLGASHSGD